MKNIGIFAWGFLLGWLLALAFGCLKTQTTKKEYHEADIIHITDGESGFVVYGECAPFPCESNLWNNARMNDPQAWKEAANE